MLVVGERHDAAVVPRRVHLKAVRRTAQGSDRGGAFYVVAVLDPVGVNEFELTSAAAREASQAVNGVL